MQEDYGRESGGKWGIEADCTDPGLLTVQKMREKAKQPLANVYPTNGPLSVCVRNLGLHKVEEIFLA